MADRYKTSLPMISSETGGINFDGVSTDGTGNGILTVGGFTNTGTSTVTGTHTVNGTEALLGAILQLSESTVATPSGAAQTIATSKIISRTAPSGACTGAILAAGTKDGQFVIVTNESTVVANTITFSTTLATGLVAVDATPTAVVIKAASAAAFVWLASLNSGTGAWVHFAPAAG